MEDLKTRHFFYHEIITLKLFLMLQGWIEGTLTMANGHSETIRAGRNGAVK